jgi:hypothetical protein
MDNWESLAIRLQNHIESIEDCKIWTGLVLNNGYGQIWFNGRMISTHRAAYMLYKGDIPQGQMIRHTCDTKVCCEPSHIILGTHADNMKDMVERNRSHKRPGELHPLAKLTDKDVLEIRAKYATGQYTQKQLGDLYGVHRVQISRIYLKKDWKHI